ncbi:hypothetical protein CAI21_08325 [Alkalilimnicola ehrlichii]|uniref:ABC transporter permease n=2 Tax=Alkalilimnicola ehrlichii TaxID=351052 RepID=A0A3E0WX28_9GAMM|nr:hypothetical protein CAI21_08325 [Alkalilimnicola ehrlichii]RFA36555.1 hypothetical protein CAL65_10595 [Alkalilimnicola ehrlichii]
MGLALLGIALGVAVVVAVDLANQSASRGFSVSHEALTGRTTHQILPGPGGLPERLYTELRQAGFHRAAPVVEGQVQSKTGATLRIWGRPLAEGAIRPALGGLRAPAALGDWLLRPNAVLLLAADAERQGVAEGGRLPVVVQGQEVGLTVLGLLEPLRAIDREGLRDVLVMDIGAAQELLGKLGRLDRIDLILAQGQADAVAGYLPADAQLVSAADQAAALEQMTAAFQLNLTAFSLLALLVGAFLIYNSMTFSVVQRRPLIGNLRAVGVTRAQIFRLILVEALVLGAVGTALGIGLGILLSELLLELVTRTINDLYFVLAVREPELAPLSLFKGFALGVGATALAALAPAWEATSAPPRAILARASLEQRARGAVPYLAGLGVLLIGLGVLLLAGSEQLVLNFAGLFALILGAALLVPASTLLLTRLLVRPLGAALGLLGRMAARSVRAGLSRTAVAIAALMIAVSAVVGVGVMVDSFRHTFSLWLESTLRADVYVSALRGSPEGLEPELIERLAAVEGVDWYSTTRSVRVAWGEQRVRLRAFDIPPFGESGFRFKEGDPQALWPAFQDAGAALVTEPFAAHHGVELGDRLRLATAEGERDFPVVGIMYDYSTSEGAVVISRRSYERYWDDPGIDSLGIHAEPGVSLSTLREDLQAAAAGAPVSLQLNRELRQASLDVFDQTFTITHVLRLLAMIVAGIGVLSALLALALERGREFAVLRATGFTPRQVGVLVTLQTGVLGLIAGLLAIPLGLAMAAALILVINQRSFGWSMLISVNGGELLQALALALVSALLAGAYPAWRLARSVPAQALREE